MKLPLSEMMAHLELTFNDGNKPKQGQSRLTDWVDSLKKEWTPAANEIRLVYENVKCMVHILYLFTILTKYMSYICPMWDKDRMMGPEHDAENSKRAGSAVKVHSRWRRELTSPFNA